MKKNRPITLAYHTPVLSQNAQAIIRGVSSYVRLHADWHLRITHDKLDKVLPSLKSRGVDGAFVSPTSRAEEGLVARCGIPCILTHVTEPQKVLPYFTANNRLVGQMGAEHFIEKGFTNFAYYSLITVCSGQKSDWRVSRSESAKQAARFTYSNLPLPARMRKFRRKRPSIPGRQVHG